MQSKIWTQESFSNWSSHFFYSSHYIASLGEYLDAFSDIVDHICEYHFLPQRIAMKPEKFFESLIQMCGEIMRINSLRDEDKENVKRYFSILFRLFKISPICSNFYIEFFSYYIFNPTYALYHNNREFFTEICQAYVNSDSATELFKQFDGNDELPLIFMRCAIFFFYVPFTETGTSEERLNEIFSRIIEKMKLLQLHKNRNAVSEQLADFITNTLMSLGSIDKLTDEKTSQTLDLLAEQIKSEFFDKQMHFLKYLHQICNQPKFSPHVFKWLKDSGFADYLYHIEFKSAFLPIFAELFKSFSNADLLTVDNFKAIWSQHTTYQTSSINQFYHVIIEIFATMKPGLIIGCIQQILESNEKNDEWINLLKQICAGLGHRGNQAEAINLVHDHVAQLAKQESENQQHFADLAEYLSCIGLSHDQIVAKLTEISKLPELSRLELMILVSLLPNRKIIDKELANKLLTLVVASITKNPSNAQNYFSLIHILTTFNDATFTSSDVSTLLESSMNSQNLLNFMIMLLERYMIKEEQVLSAIENLPENKINAKFYTFIKKAFFSFKNDPNNPSGLFEITSLPFMNEDLLWTLCLRDSFIQERFMRLLARIYCRNSETYLPDEDMIHIFLTKWSEKFFEQTDNKIKNSLVKILTHFVKICEKDVYPPNYGFSRHKQVRASEMITVNAEFHDSEVSLVVCRSMSVAALTKQIADEFDLHYSGCQLEHDDFPVDFDKDLSIFDEHDSVDVVVTGGKCPDIRERTTLPSLAIIQMKLHTKLIRLMDDLPAIVELLDELPTHEDLVDVIGKMHDMGLDKVFPNTRPRFFKYNFDTFINRFTLSDIPSLKEVGLFQYILTVGLENNEPILLENILSWLQDILNNGVDIGIDEQILFDQILRLLRNFPMNESSSKLFRNAFDAVHNLNDPRSLKFDLDTIKVLILKFLASENDNIAFDSCMFFEKLNIPSSVYAELSSEVDFTKDNFFSSWSDHIMNRDETAVNIVMSNLTETVSWGHLDLLDALLEFHAMNEEEIEKITTFICNNFLDPGAEAKGAKIFESAMNVAKHLNGPKIVAALHHLCATSFREWDIDGDKIVLQKSGSYVGLDNLGVTCFVDSVLQQLFRITEVRQAVFDFVGKNSFIKQLQYLFANMMYSNLQSVSTQKLLNAWSNDSDDVLDTNVQQDACEFLQLLLDKLEKILGKDKLSLFNGEFINRIESLDGSLSSESTETYIALPVDVLHSRTLDESLKKISTPEILKGAYKFEGTDQKVDVKKFCLFGKAPKNLIIQLKRFEYNFETFVRYKVKTPLSFPAELSLAGKDYKLAGVIMHSGSADFGHYISYCLQENGTWQCFNDNIVTQVTLEHVLSVGRGEKGTWSAFILFYDSEPQKPVTVPKKFMDYVRSENDYNCLTRLTFSSAATDLFNYFLGSKDDSLFQEAVQFSMTFAAFTVDGINGAKLLKNANKTLMERPQVCANLVKALSKLFLSNLFIYCKHNEVRLAASNVVISLMKVVGPSALDIVNRYFEDFEAHPEHLEGIMSIYVEAAQIEACKPVLKSKVLDQLEDLVRHMEPQRAKSHSMDHIFNAILAIGPSNGFGDEIVSTRWVEKYFTLTDLTIIADVIRKSPTAPDQLRKFAAKTPSPKWRNLLKLFPEIQTEKQ